LGTLNERILRQILLGVGERGLRGRILDVLGASAFSAIKKNATRGKRK